jgi:hypothetical protein
MVTVLGISNGYRDGDGIRVPETLTRRKVVVVGVVVGLPGSEQRGNDPTVVVWMSGGFNSNVSNPPGELGLIGTNGRIRCMPAGMGFLRRAHQRRSRGSSNQSSTPVIGRDANPNTPVHSMLFFFGFNPEEDRMPSVAVATTVGCGPRCFGWWLRLGSGGHGRSEGLHPQRAEGVVVVWVGGGGCTPSGRGIGLVRSSGWNGGGGGGGTGSGRVAVVVVVGGPVTVGARSEAGTEAETGWSCVPVWNRSASGTA